MMKHMPRLQDFFKKYPHLIIILFGTLVRLPLLFAPLNSYGTDAWRQADTASIAYHFYINGYRLLYPQIFWGGNSPGYVETEFQLYTYLVALLYSFFGEQLWLGRLVSVIFSILAWVVFYWLARKILNNTTLAAWSLFFLVFSPSYIRYSVAFMPEATVMFFYIAAIWFYMNWLSDSKTAMLFLASICVLLAALVKPTSVHIGLVFALLALQKWGATILKRKEIWIAIVVILLPAGLWYWHARNLFLEYGNTFGLLSGGDSKFGNVAIWSSPHFYLSLLRLDAKWVLGYGLVLLFAAGIISALKRQGGQLTVFGIAVIAFYYMIVARYSSEEWGIQYHVYMLPFAALAAAFGVEWIRDRYNHYIQMGILLLSIAIFFYTSAKFYLDAISPGADNFMACAGYVKDLVPSNQLMIVSTTSYASDNGTPNNYQEPQIFFYSHRYGWSLPADRHTADELLRLRHLGAAYFVVYSKELLMNNHGLDVYLNQNSLQIGPGIDAGCAIYSFNN
jgi:4-amino-4-deoxy-L-arabinose transferase-like glycosyltransferase